MPGDSVIVEEEKNRAQGLVRILPVSRHRRATAHEAIVTFTISVIISGLLAHHEKTSDEWQTAERRLAATYYVARYMYMYCILHARSTRRGRLLEERCLPDSKDMTPCANLFRIDLASAN